MSVPVGVFQPAAAADSAGNQFVFWEGNDQNLYEMWSYGSWNGPVNLGMGPLGSAPAVTVTPSGQVTVFWRGSNGHLVETYYANGWVSPIDLGYSGMVTAPTADSFGTQIDVFWEGSGNTLQEAWEVGTTWSQTAVPGVSTVDSPAAAAHRSTVDAGEVDIFWRGTDNSLQEAWYTSTGWHHGAVSQEGRTVGSAPTVAVKLSDQADVFWAAVGTLYLDQGWWIPPNWNGPAEPLGSGSGVLASAPAADAWTSGTDVYSDDVYWEGSDATLKQARWNGAQWTGPTSLHTFPPAAPTTVTAAAGNTSATVAWTAPVTSQGLTSYVVTPFIGASAQTSLAVTVSGSTTSTTVTGLTNGTAYTFQVVATNSAGSGPAGVSNAATPGTVPGAPTNATAAGGNAQATVSWTAPSSNGGSALTGYTVTPYIGTTAQSPTTVAPSVTTATITGLSNGSTYTFHVVASNVFGSGAAATTNAVEPAQLPGAPTPVSATAGDGRANVSWHAPAAPGNIVSSYTVTPYMGSTALTNRAVTITSTNAAGVITATSIGGLSDGTAYTFQVTATNGTGTGPAGTSNPVTPTPPAPLTLTTGHGYANGSVPQDVVLGDLTAAGLPDIVTANGGNNSLSALLNQVHNGPSGGTFTQPATVSSTGSASANDVAVGDFNGDGKLDSAVVNGSHTITMLIGAGDGSFGPTSTTLTLGNQSASLVTVGDVNGDGKADIVVVGGADAFPNNDTIAVYLGNGDGTFQAPIQNASHDNQCLGCGFFPTGLILADLNGDGRPDIVFSNTNTSGGTDSGGVSVLLNAGGGSFGSWHGVASLPGPRSNAPNQVVAVADLNGDGIPDIVALESPIGNSNTRGIAIVLGVGGGNFASPVYVADPSLTNGSSTYGGGQALAIADVNGDGNPDIVTADDNSSSASPGISVYLNPGGGSIDTPTFIPTRAFTPHGIALGDVNGDHEPDVVLENNNGTSPSAPSNVMVLLNGTDFPPLGSALAPGEMHGCYMCQAVQGGGALRIDGTYPITVNSGEMSHTFTDISIPARGYPLAITQTYNDLAAGTDAGLGYGWWSPLLMSVTSDANTGITSVTQEDGAVAQFWTSSLLPVAARTQATLTRNGDGTWTFIRYHADTFAFNASGQIVSIANLTGDSLSFGYGGGSVTSVTHSDGRSLAIAWSGGHISSITDANVAGTARTVSFTYDGSGQLTDIDWKVNGGDDRNEHFAYESTPWNHGMTAMRDPRGVTVAQVYDSSGHTTSQTIDPSGLNRTTTYSYTVSNGAITQALITDPAGHQELDTFSYGELTQKILGYNTPQAATWSYSYDPSSIATTMAIDPNGSVTTAVYDGYGNPLASTDPLGRTTTHTYGGNGGADALHNQPTTMTDPNGVTTTFSYDPTSRTLTQTSTPLAGSSPAVNRVVQDQHTNLSHPGDTTALVDADGKTWSYGYDADGNRTSTADPVGDRSSSTYNADGWMLTAVSPKGDPSVCAGSCTPAQYTTTYGYIDASGGPDFWGLPTSVTDPLGHVTRMAYDADNNRVQLVDGDGNATTYQYDNANELTVTQRADTTTTRTDYNADGTVADQIDGNSNTLQSYSYNSLAQRVTVTVDSGASPHLNQTTTYTYDGLGNVTSKQDPGGSCSGTLSACTTYGYDAASQLTSIHYSDGGTANVTLQYDGDGQRTSMTDGTGQSAWQYDSLQRLTSVTEDGNGTVGYQYDLRGLVTQIAYPGGGHTVTQGYDDAGRMTSVQDWNGATSQFKYDANSNLYESDLASGTALVDASSFNKADQRTSINDTFNGTTVFGATYTRDGNGQVASDTSATTGQNAYAYTPLNQVCYAGASATTPCSSPPGGSQTFTSDPGGNLTSIGTTVQAFNTADELTASGSTTYQYDSRGNRTSATAAGTTTSYGYDQANRLCWAGSTSSGSTCSGTVQANDTLYCYDGDGLRMAKVTAGSCAAPATEERFTWDVSGNLPLLLVDGTTDYIYGPTGLPLEQISGSGTLWYHQDQLGSTRAVTDGSGTTQATYTFDPYGNVLSATGSSSHQPFQFAGQYRDAETGFYYLRARYYDPKTAQFLSRDPAVATTHEPYGYVSGDPLNESDPSGLDFNLPFGGLCVHFFLGSSNCQGSLSQDVVKSGAFQAANGFANGFSFGLSTKVEDTFGAAPNTNSGCFQGGNIGGNVAGIVLLPAGAARAIGAGLREVGIGTRLAIHDAHHTFGALGDLPHIQLNWWRIGVKGSGGVIRIPLPPIWPFS